MKTNVTLFTFILVFAVSMKLNAQNHVDETWKLMNQNVSSVSVFSTDQSIPGRKLILLGMNFSESDWLNAKDKIPKGSIAEMVELVSTDFAVNPEFDQDKLDLQRLHKLNQLMPELFMDARTGWERIHETGGTTVETSRKLFHGFAIIIRPPATTESTALEIKTLSDEFLGTKTAKEIPAVVPREADKLESKIDYSSSDKTFASTDSLDSGYIIYKAKAEGKSKKHIEKKSCPLYDEKAETRYAKSETPTPVASTYSWMLNSYSTFSDSTVTAIMRRNKQWKEMLVVSDITGSMSPYTAQLLAWYKLNTMNDRVKNFVFFNDGDNKPDNQKIAGATGGLYGIVASQFDSVVYEAIYAMTRGCGGDAPENNVEALEYGLKNYGDAKEVVMIADNWATPRDLEFAYRINRPVHIIVCGAAYGMNVAYLNLALKTGGSVHTMEQDLTDLAKLHSGEVISIGKFKYALGADGTFTMVSSL